MPRLRSRPPIVHHPAARARALTLQAAQKAARARIELAIVIPLIGLVLLANEYRQELFGLDLSVRIFTAIALLILGWRLARDVGRTLAPQLFKRMDPATAGTVGFLVRLAFLVATLLRARDPRGLDRGTRGRTAARRRRPPQRHRSAPAGRPTRTHHPGVRVLAGGGRHPG